MWFHKPHFNPLISPKNANFPQSTQFTDPRKHGRKKTFKFTPKMQESSENVSSNWLFRSTTSTDMNISDNATPVNCLDSIYTTSKYQQIYQFFTIYGWFR
jgi:hypothetical protein